MARPPLPVVYLFHHLCHSLAGLAPHLRKRLNFSESWVLHLYFLFRTGDETQGLTTTELHSQTPGFSFLTRGCE
jgi:hypothetical protein